MSQIDAKAELLGDFIFDRDQSCQWIFDNVVAPGAPQPLPAVTCQLDPSTLDLDNGDGCSLSPLVEYAHAGTR